MKIYHSMKGRLATWSVKGIAKRMASLMTHYGFTNQKIRKKIYDFSQLLNNYNVIPTFPVTASVLNRNPQVFKEIQDLGVEFAVHGYRHVDYTQLSSQDVHRHLSQAVEIFNNQGIHFSGYRFPYLRRDEERKNLLKEFGFKWDSSDVIDWEVLNQNKFLSKKWNDYQKILKTYKATTRDLMPSLPYTNHGIIEIPVSIPDDDILIERLGIRDQYFITNIWENIVNRIRKKEELFVLQAHPERFSQFKKPVEQIIQSTKQYKDVWIAPLGEIADWWQERKDFTFKVRKIRKNKFRIVTSCSDRFGFRIAGINQDNVMLPKEFSQWEMTCEVRPVIGLAPDPSEEISEFMNQEGFFYEIGHHRKDYAYYIPEIKNFDMSKKNKILHDIERCPNPILKYNRWPKGHCCCLAITGDIDGLDIWDIMERYHG
jgi:peptidoglycan/xylan/chitin deacetylase (PgdA/CDA1 family)